MATVSERLLEVERSIKQMENTIADMPQSAADLNINSRIAEAMGDLRSQLDDVQRATKTPEPGITLCRKCVFAVVAPVGGSSSCRRLPPVYRHDQAQGVWPAVRTKTDGCGEGKSK